jgi:hypothetical protein
MALATCERRTGRTEEGVQRTPQEIEERPPAHCTQYTAARLLAAGGWRLAGWPSRGGLWDLGSGMAGLPGAEAEAQAQALCTRHIPCTPHPAPRTRKKQEGGAAISRGYPPGGLPRHSAFEQGAGVSSPVARAHFIVALINATRKSVACNVQARHQCWYFRASTACTPLRLTSLSTGLPASP